MKLYLVTYAINNWSSDRKTVRVVANSVVKAAQEVSKSKYTGYSGYVVSVEETFSTVHIAK